MALIHLDFESQYYNANTDVYVIIPDKKRGIDPKDFYKREDRFKCLWLLHGTFGSYSDWIRKSNIELYACEHDLMVVMPSVQNFDYEEWDNAGLGLDTTKMIVDELMPMIQNWFPASDKREDNFVAGLSMGGGGALKLALNYPEKFSACLLFYKSVNFHCNMCIVLIGRCAHYRANGLCDTALLTDYPAHVIGSDMEMVNSYTVFIRFVNVHGYRGRIIYEALRNGNE